jgi:Ca2+-binding EF-hand superfamily protein
MPTLMDLVYGQAVSSLSLQVKHIFDRYDSDGSGELSVVELKEMMKEVWKDADSIKEMIQEVDKDGNGEVSES